MAAAISTAFFSAAIVGWLLSVTPAIAIAANVFVVAAAAAATATTADTVAVLLPVAVIANAIAAIPLLVDCCLWPPPSL